MHLQDKLLEERALVSSLEGFSIVVMAEHPASADGTRPAHTETWVFPATATLAEALAQVPAVRTGTLVNVSLQVAKFSRSWRERHATRQ